MLQCKKIRRNTSSMLKISGQSYQPIFSLWGGKKIWCRVFFSSTEKSAFYFMVIFKSSHKWSRLFGSKAVARIFVIKIYIWISWAGIFSKLPFDDILESLLHKKNNCALRTCDVLHYIGPLVSDAKKKFFYKAKNDVEKLIKFVIQF